jgi:hypothetical protein
VDTIAARKVTSMTKRAKPKHVVRVRTHGAGIVARALDFAVERGMNRHDKYSEAPLSEASRRLLSAEIVNSFALTLSDLDAEIR